MTNRPGFWQAKGSDDTQNGAERGENGVSKQFLPNRERNGSSEWLDTQSRNSAANHGFTPFKSVQQKKEGSLNRKQPADPFQYSPSAFAKDQPQSQSTPKVGARPGSAIPRVPIVPTVPTATRDRGATWGRQPNGLPPTHHFRSVSAMGHPGHPTMPAMGTFQRTGSRTSEVPVPQMGSRYHSYTTLPRPDQPLDPYQLHDHPFYAHHFYQPQHQQPQPKMIISRPPSAMPPQQMGAEFGQPIPAIVQKSPQNSQPFPVTSAIQSNPNMSTSMTSRRSEIVSWNALSLLCSLQVLCGLAIFGLGVFRMLQHAKWALGVELGYAISVLISGMAGISSVRSTSYCGATFAYVLAAANCLFSGAPFVLGLLPIIPYGFPSVDPRFLVNKDEPFEIDLAMSLVVAISCLLSFVMVIFGCKALGNACRVVEKLKARADIDTTFGVEPLPIKQ
ncbi:unnamed protein product, partial [Mesorhabditis belari]|uniref:Uncharacterized protein n=1 Tax=Mesorhabditis belari TaxID=2138241 RepID=A0AAF3EWH4_9BILA